MKDRIDSLSHEYTSPIEVEDRQDAIMKREDFRTGLGQTTHREDDQGMDKIEEVGQDTILIIGVAMDIICYIIKDMGDRIIITEGQILEIKVMIGIGISHMRDRIETEGTIEALVTAYQDQVQEQLQIGIGLDVLSVGNMTISQETDNTGKQRSRRNATDVQYG